MACEAGECPSTHVLIFSGCMEFDLGGMGSLVGLMPEAMFVGTLSERYPEILPILEAMEREARHGRAGFAGILAHLANVVAAFIVRAWAEFGVRRGERLGVGSARPAPRRRDRRRSSGPGGDWTVADLVAAMGSSRSIFAERSGGHRFDAITIPDRARMSARRRVDGRDRMPIDVAAHRLGYGSQAAFSRASTGSIALLRDSFAGLWVHVGAADGTRHHGFLRSRFWLFCSQTDLSNF